MKSIECVQAGDWQCVSVCPSLNNQLHAASRTQLFSWRLRACLLLLLQADEERNYHIFYQLCASSHLPELKPLKLGKSCPVLSTPLPASLSCNPSVALQSMKSGEEKKRAKSSDPTQTLTASANSVATATKCLPARPPWPPM